MANFRPSGTPQDAPGSNAMRERTRELVRQGEKQFAERYPILTLWQAVCENFHVMRADFTRARYLSEEFGSYLMSGRPGLCFRELKDSFAAMLRRDQWFHAKTDSEQVNEDRVAKGWLENADKIMRRAMYDRRAQFVRATKIADGDFCAVGNACITRDIVDFSHLLYKTWHLRDVCWTEDYKGVINRVWFKWEPQAYKLLEKFPKTAAQQVKDIPKDQQDKKIHCRRILLPADDYDLPRDRQRDLKWVSIYVDIDNEVILEEMPLRSFPATIPRWELADSVLWSCQYGYSPATVYGLPDGRMFQQLTLTMLEVAQKAADPPLAAVGEAIIGGANLYAGGISWKDADYDERTGKAIEHLLPPFDGVKYGAEREEKLEAALADAFFLSKIKFPEITKDMTATEVNRLWQEYIRTTVPLFEPVQDEYNGALCEDTFQDLLEAGTFGSIHDMPQALRGRDITYQFDTPLTIAAEKALTEAFQQMQGVTVTAMQIDPTVRFNTDWNKAYRDAVDGTGAPADWLRSEDEALAMAQQDAQQQAARQAAQDVASHADAASRVATAAEGAGKAGQALQQAGMM